MARILQSSLIFSIILALFATSNVQADVDIVYFLADYQINTVVLDWETNFEVNFNGFFVTRSNTQNGPFTHISNLIPGKGEGGFGSTYEFTDELVSNDMTYWYQLEVVDNDNRTSYSNVVRVVTDQTHTPTATVTATTFPGAPTGSPTATVFFSSGTTSPARTSTATVFFSSGTTSPGSTSTPTAPLLPGVATATGTGPIGPTPMESPTLIATEALSATATLIPLPEITLQFPTPVSNLDISSEGSVTKPDDPSEQQRKNVVKVIVRAAFIGFIALIWLILGIWFYVSSRRIE